MTFIFEYRPYKPRKFSYKKLSFSPCLKDISVLLQKKKKKIDKIDKIFQKNENILSQKLCYQRVVCILEMKQMKRGWIKKVEQKPKIKGYPYHFSFGSKIEM